MGWSSGSELFNKIIESVQPAVPDEAARVAIYANIIPSFEYQDWDTQDECMGKDPAFEKALQKLSRS